MKHLLFALSLFALCAVSRAATPLTDVKLSGTGNEVKSTATATVNGTLTIGAAGSLTTTSGATITLADPLAVANGGTGAATASAARTALGLGTIATAAADDYVAAADTPAAGDLPYFDGDDWVSLAAGSDDQVLTLASGVPTWADAPTGFTNPMSAAGDLIYGGTSGAATRLAKGTAGQVLTMNTGATAPEWADVPAGFTNPMTTAADLIVGGTSGAADRLAVGSDGQVLKVVSGALAWSTDSTGTGTLPATPTAGDLPYFDGDDWVSLAAGSDDQVLTLASGVPTWADAPTGFTNPMSAAGDLIYGGTSGAATRLAKGTAGQVLTMNTGATAPEWDDVPAGFSNPMTTAADLIVGGTSGAADRLAVGSDGQVLKVVSGALAWSTDSTGTGTLPASPTAGDIAYYDGTDWSSLGIGTAGQVLTTNTGATAPEWADAAAGSGDVVGPASSTDARLALFDSTTGKLLKQSTALTDSSGTLTSNDAIGLAAGGSNKNVTITPSGSGATIVNGSFYSVAASSTDAWSSVETQSRSQTATFGLFQKSSTARDYGIYFKCDGTFSDFEIKMRKANSDTTIVYVHNNNNHIEVKPTDDASSSTDAAVTFAGGVGVAKKLYVGTDANIGGGLSLTTAGKTLSVKSGTNAKAGTFTLSSGAATVSNTSVTADSVVVMSLKTSSGTISQAPYLSAISAGTSFTVAAGAGDNSTYNYIILEVN